MTTTTDPELDRDDLAAALRRERDALTVAPTDVGVVRSRGRRRRARRRTAGAALAAAAALAGAVATASLVDRPADRVRTATVPTPAEVGPAVVPLFAPTPYDPATDPADPPIHVSQVDVLEPDGSRTPWSRWGPDPQWAVGHGIVLGDGRRVAPATGGYGTEVAGEQALVELGPDGSITAVHPLDLGPAAADASLAIAGAEGDEVDVVVDATVLVPGAATGATPAVSLLTVDLATGAVTTRLDGLDGLSVRSAAGRIVAVHDDVSLTEPCRLDVRSRAAVDEVRTVPVACATGAPLPPMVRLLALDPTGRYAAVERTTLTSGSPDLSLLVIDLDEETTTEVATATAGPPWTSVSWSSAGALRLAMPTDNPELPAIDVPSPAGGPEVRVIGYTDS
ncbi:MAG: hypothetical protein R2702_04215 [Acidimicrobiales bacterium]